MTHNSLLISTMLNFIHYDGQDYHIIDSGKLEEGNAHYMGITWNGIFTIVSCCQDFKYGYKTFTRDFKQLGFFGELNLHETHQIIEVDGHIFFVNTGLNRIDILPYKGKAYHKSFNEATCDIDHLNGI